MFFFYILLFSDLFELNHLHLSICELIRLHVSCKTYWINAQIHENVLGFFVKGSPNRLSNERNEQSQNNTQKTDLTAFALAESEMREREHVNIEIY